MKSIKEQIAKAISEQIEQIELTAEYIYAYRGFHIRKTSKKQW